MPGVPDLGRSEGVAVLAGTAGLGVAILAETAGLRAGVPCAAGLVAAAWLKANSSKLSLSNLANHTLRVLLVKTLSLHRPPPLNVVAHANI